MNTLSFKHFLNYIAKNYSNLTITKRNGEVSLYQNDKLVSVTSYGHTLSLHIIKYGELK